VSPLFRRQPKPESEIVPVPDLAAYAQTRGWRAAPDRPFDGHLEDVANRVTLSMYIHERLDTFVRERNRIGNTVFRDAYRLTVDDRVVTVANGWTNIQAQIRYSPDNWRGVSVCAVELPAVLMLQCIQPRRLQPVVNLQPTPVGNPEFDATFSAVGAPGFETSVISEEMQQRIMVRDDWIFYAERYLFGCFRHDPFSSAAEVAQRISDVLDIVAAIPTDVLPATVDHSHDDLIARINNLKTVDDAMAFLQALTPDEREQLAHSDTPLAAFAGVRTPDEVRARLQTLDPQQRLELLAMFMRVKDDQQQQRKDT
jgi:hypothetical protein